MKKTGPVWALGTMSGTSLDGVDAAMLLTDGVQIVEFGKAGYQTYTEADRASIRAVFGREEGDAGVGEAAEVVEDVHVALLSGFMGAEVVGFHGQTISHKPQAGRTCQIGNGGMLAEVLGLPVVWDFRSADMEMGGQGAPLAPFFHFACAKWIGASEPLAFLNIGGVANLTWVDPGKALPEQDGALLAFDTGPGNAQLNDLMQKRRGLDRDQDGVLAASGQVDQAVLDSMEEPGYFMRIPPKSLDRDDFSFLSQKVSRLSDPDAAATLTAASVMAVVRGIQHCPRAPARLLVTGGGRHNPVMMRMLADGLDCPVDPVEAVGLDGDMLEAQAFAHLAVRVLRGLPTSCPSTTGVRAAIGGGRISRPAATDSLS